MEGSIKDKVTGEIRGDPRQDPVLLQVNGFMMRTQLSAVSL
jgi:hypothetical protein